MYVYFRKHLKRDVIFNMFSSLPLLWQRKKSENWLIFDEAMSV